MARSTQAQKARRLNAAYRLLSRRLSTAEAATRLAREYRMSLRQAYRYLQQATRLARPVPIAEPGQLITFRIPGRTIRALRAYAAAHDLTLSEVLTRAIEQCVARTR